MEWAKERPEWGSLLALSPAPYRTVNWLLLQVGLRSKQLISVLGKARLGVLFPHLVGKESPFSESLHEAAGDGAKDGGTSD